MFRIIFILITLLLQACTEPVEVVKVNEPTVVQLSEVKLVDVSNEYEFPATVSAVTSVDIKFEVAGRLIFTDLVEGSKVSKGQILAQIDPTPFERRVAEAQIRFEDATRDLKRVKEVFSRNVASQSALDDAKSQYALTELALANAKQDLSYCTVRAPFDGVVGARYIENNSYISTSMALANLQDRSKLYFNFDVPERIMTANAGNRDIEATAQMIGQKDNVFNIYYVEHETTPNSVTQTYGVTFALEGKAANLFYPGSRASVKVKSKLSQQSALYIPVNALSGDEASGFSVWRFTEETSQIHAVKVKIAGLKGEYAVIADGLVKGDKIVSAAVNQMSEGLTVKEYKADF